MNVPEQQDLARRAAQLEAILENAVDAIITIDERGIVESVNPATERVFGYPPSEVVGQNIKMLMPAPYSQEHDHYIANYLRTGQRKIIGLGREVIGMRKDGSTFPMELAVSEAIVDDRRFFTGIVRDLTERYQAEELMRVQQRAIEAASSGIVITDPNKPDNPIVICNRAFLEMTGYPEDEVIGLNCRFLQHDDRDQPAIDMLRGAIAAAKDCRVLLRNYRKDGSMFWNDLQISPVHDAQGRLTHFVGVVADVTEREQKHHALRETIEEKSEQLRVAESELIKQARLATLGQVFGGIAHEIRNPLNALRTSAYYLLRVGQPSPEKLEEHLKRIDRQVTIIDNIVTALSDVARLPQPRLSPVPLPTWVNAAAREVTLPLTIELKIDLPSQLPSVMVDVNQVPIALKNLVRNARDAMPNGGVISISARSENDYVSLTVEDTGEGIPEDVLPNVMEPLFTTKPKGMGLGLAICRAIIEKNEGTIEVESKVGRGTSFKIRFKAAKSDPHV